MFLCWTGDEMGVIAGGGISTSMWISVSETGISEGIFLGFSLEDDDSSGVSEESLETSSVLESSSLELQLFPGSSVVVESEEMPAEISPCPGFSSVRGTSGITVDKFFFFKCSAFLAAFLRKSLGVFLR